MSAEEASVLAEAAYSAWLLQSIAEEGIKRGTTPPEVLTWLQGVENFCRFKLAGQHPS